jgi:hypothetical protein
MWLGTKQKINLDILEKKIIWQLINQDELENMKKIFYKESMNMCEWQEKRSTHQKDERKSSKIKTSNWNIILKFRSKRFVLFALYYQYHINLNLHKFSCQF